MTSKTLLETGKSVTGELGFTQPTVMTSSQVATDIQLRYLTLAAGEQLLDMHDWQGLIETHSFVTDGGTAYDMPADFHRFVNQTIWNATTQTELTGTAKNALWNQYVANNDNTKFRVVGDQLHLAAASTGETITFDYISKFFVIDGGGGVNKAEFTLDSDSTVYHARLLIDFVKLKFLQVKNLGTAAAVEDFNGSLRYAIGADTPSPALSTAAPISVWEEQY
jgi:hypothetical protein